MNGEIAMTEEKRTWNEVLDALEHDYTMSIRDVCRLLKASRPWVNRYIKPHVDTIYLNSNRRGEYQIGQNWVKLAAQILKRKEMTDSTWFHTKALYALLERSVVSVTKQTKSVPLVYLIEESKREIYLRERDVLLESLKTADTAEEEQEMVSQLANLPGRYIDEDGLELMKSHCGITQRGNVERIDVDYPGEFDPTKWIAAHDIKDYGDTDEDVYRQLFRRGCIRIEICVPDTDGAPGNKIYYVEDPTFISNKWNERVLNIPEPVWQRYAQKKGL